MFDHVLGGFFALDLERVRAAAAEVLRPGASHGAVPSLETIYRHDRRIKFARQGLFTEAVFGPAQDFLCSCGALAGREREGEVCARCGVECGSASLRAQRFGHIDVVGVVLRGDR